ncbi:MAG: hypothetical protein KGL39_47350 [Patescibacteria group bacterium]|nr:hypothetical protein [Patescibacteria group bacterium]
MTNDRADALCLSGLALAVLVAAWRPIPSPARPWAEVAVIVRAPETTFQGVELVRRFDTRKSCRAHLLPRELVTVGNWTTLRIYGCARNVGKFAAEVSEAYHEKG